VPIGPYIADFCHLSSKLIVEIDGNQHGYEAHAAHDERRTHHLNQLGFTLIRFTNRDVMSSVDAVLDTILAHLSAYSLPLAGRDKGWGSQSRSAAPDPVNPKADTSA
jgi:very-short-patch-repair endonuclease